MKGLAFAALWALASCGGATPTAADVNAVAPDAPEAASTVFPPSAGRLPPSVIQEIVRSHFGAMRRCYQEGLAWNRDLTGTIIVRFVIAGDGSVASAMEDHDSPDEKRALPVRFSDPWAVQCVVAQYKTMKFPSPEGGKVTVVYPIVFSPGP